MENLIYLMHKDEQAAVLSLQDTTGVLLFVRVINDRIMPPGTRGCHPDKLGDYLHRWINNRIIPPERNSSELLINISKEFNVKNIIYNNYGCSLNDCYWFRPASVFIKWDDVSFYKHHPDSNLGKSLFYNKYQPVNNYRSPDLTTGGKLPKVWMVDDDDFYLYKSTEGDVPGVYRELFAYEVAKILNLNVVPYFSLTDPITEEKVLMCPSFIENDDEEYIPLLSAEFEANSANQGKILDFIYKNGLINDFEKMLVFDFIIAKNGRSFNDCGYIRNSEDLSVIEFAPIFGNTQCMQYRASDRYILNGENNLFNENNIDTLDRVKDFTWIDCGKFQNIIDAGNSVLSQAIPKNIMFYLIDALKCRLDVLSERK